MPRVRFCRAKNKGRVKPNKDDKRPITKKIRSRWYPFRITKIKRGVNNPTKLRRGLTAGTILILLTGPYRGRRVVFLKQLNHSGLLLVTGPYCINGVPLRRVGQKFVIITSTKLDLSNVKGLEDIKDEYFKIPKKDRKSKFPKEKKQIQKNLDDQLMKQVEQTEYMKEYLRSYFTITPGKPPHAIKF